MLSKKTYKSGTIKISIPKWIWLLWIRSWELTEHLLFFSYLFMNIQCYKDIFKNGNRVLTLLFWPLAFFNWNDKVASFTHAGYRATLLSFIWSFVSGHLMNVLPIFQFLLSLCWSLVYVLSDFARDNLLRIWSGRTLKKKVTQSPVTVFCYWANILILLSHYFHIYTLRHINKSNFKRCLAPFLPFIFQNKAWFLDVSHVIWCLLALVLTY